MSFQTQVLLVPSLWIYPSCSGSLLPGSGSDYPLLLQMAMRPSCPREAKSCGQPTWGVKCPKYSNPSTPMGLLLLAMPVLGLREKAVGNEINTASCPQLIPRGVYLERRLIPSFRSFLPSLQTAVASPVSPVEPNWNPGRRSEEQTQGGPQAGKRAWHLCALLPQTFFIQVATSPFCCSHFVRGQVSFQPEDWQWLGVS